MHLHLPSLPTSREIAGSCNLDNGTAKPMTDIVDRATRSRMMAGISAKDTKPERILRRALHARGFRFRLHVRNLPGTPDLVLRRYPRRLLRSRLFLAPPSGMLVRDYPSDKARILASQVRWQCRAGPPLEARAPRSWVASRHCVGVRAPPGYAHGHIARLGAMASRRRPRIRDRSPQVARCKLQQ